MISCRGTLSVFSDASERLDAAVPSGRRVKLLKLNSWGREGRALRGEGARLSGIVQAGSDAVHGGADSIIESGIERRIGRARTLAAQQIDLNQAERIDIW